MPRRHKLCWLALSTVMLATLTGCPPIKPPPELPLPAPITVDQQKAEINQRAAQFTQLKLTGDVKLIWKLDKKTRSENAEGTLWVQRVAITREANAPLKTFAALFVTKLGQPAVEMGVNREHHWLAFRGDVDEAYIGDVRGNDRVPLRADLLVSMLGMTPVGEPDSSLIFNGQPAPHAVTMTSNDVPGTNTLYEWAIASEASKQAGQVIRFVERVIVVDRRTGEIREIRLYQPTGALIARSQLSKYQDVLQQRADDDPIASGARLPTKIVISYPSREATLELSLKGLVMPLRIKPDTFRMPDFAKQGLKVKEWEKE